MAMAPLPRSKSLKEAEARAYLGVTDARWRILKKQGRVKPLGLLGTYHQDDLDKIIEDDRANSTTVLKLFTNETKSGQSVSEMGEDSAGPQGESPLLREDGGGSPQQETRSGEGEQTPKGSSGRGWPKPSAVGS